MTGALPRLLVIGAHGFLGGHLMAAARRRFDCVGAGRKDCDLYADITDAPSVAAAFAEARPDVVALVAAMADIDACERDPQKACETNVAGPRNVAAECARRGIRLIFTSSGAVFDGASRKYTEESSPNPLNVYGATKARAEATVTSLAPDAIVVRPSLILGFPCHAVTNSLMERLRVEFASGNAVPAPLNEYRNAIDVETAAGWILDLAEAREARGVFHLGSANAMSRYEIVRAIARAMGYDGSLVIADSERKPGRAPRGLYEFLSPVRIAEFSRTRPPACREAIERCVQAVA
jgi:dTDP-4-dehydrorhamnose reductase